MLELLLKF